MLLGSASSLWVLSGRDGSVMFRRENERGSFALHTTLLGPQPGSPYPRFVANHWDYGPVTPPPFSYLGRLMCFDGAPPGVDVYGSGCAGTLSSTPRIGLRDLGAAGVRVTVHGAAPNAPAALLLGCSRTSWGSIPLPFALAPFGLPQCDLLTSVELTVPVLTGSTGLAAGYANVDLPGRLERAGPFTIHAQWVCLTPTGFPGGVSQAVLWSSRP